MHTLRMATYKKPEAEDKKHDKKHEKKEERKGGDHRKKNKK